MACYRLLVWTTAMGLCPGFGASGSWAHEGHVPLPTKGVQVDVKRGTIVLSPDAERALGVETEAIEQRPLEQTVLAYATLVTPWRQQYFVSSQLTGRIAALHVSTGETVLPGQLLAEIASPELEGLELELRNAANQLRLSSGQEQRLRDLVAEQAVPEREYLEVQTEREQDQNAVRIARGKLLGLGIEDSKIKALLEKPDGSKSLRAPLFSPLHGIVGHSDRALGTVIETNEHLFEIHDLSKLWVKISVLERDITRVQARQPVQLEFPAYPGRVLRATVTAPVVEVDAVTHLGNAWAEIENPAGAFQLLPGMYGTARIITSDPTMLLSVPASALLGSGAERYVLVEVSDTAQGNEYRRLGVTILAQDSQRAQIQSGNLVPGDRVVTVGGQLLSSFFILGSLRLSPEGMRNAGLKVEPVGYQVVENVLSLEGVIDLRPGHVASVSSHLPGTLVRVCVDRGQEVEAGQVLGEIAGLPLQDTQLEMLEADLEARLLSATVQRLRNTAGTPLVAARRIQETESDWNAAVNRRESARRTLITLGLTRRDVEQILESGQTLMTLPLRSPIQGVVIRLRKVLGEGITSNEAIFEVQDLSSPLVRGYLSESDAPKVPVGTLTRIRLLADPNFVAQGRVVRSARTLGTESRTLSLWVEFDERLPRPLPRNLLAKISATIGSPQPSLAVPWSAVLHEQTLHYVFVQQPDGLLERRHVELGRSDDRFVEICQGLQAGETIAVHGTAELQTTYASVR